MNIKLPFSKLHSFVLTFILFLSVQYSINAQVTVINFTGCNLNVFVGQNDANTFAPCDPCLINPPVSTPVPAGGLPIDIFGQDVCGEDFGWIGWTITGSPGFGLSANTGLPGNCVPYLTGPPCSAIAGTNAFWAPGGSGPVTVIIF